jgi:hypothetical protein
MPQAWWTFPGALPTIPRIRRRRINPLRRCLRAPLTAPRLRPGPRTTRGRTTERSRPAVTTPATSTAPPFRRRRLPASRRASRRVRMMGAATSTGPTRETGTGNREPPPSPPILITRRIRPTLCTRPTRCTRCIPTTRRTRPTGTSRSRFLADRCNGGPGCRHRSVSGPVRAPLPRAGGRADRKSGASGPFGGGPAHSVWVGPPSCQL